MERALWRWVAVGLLACLTGCAGYRLGPTNGLAAGAKSIQITPFRNRTMEPRLSEAVTQALRKGIQQDGTYHLATQGDGDIIVTGVITQYERSAVSYLPTDVITARDLEITLTATVIAEDRSGKKLLDRKFTGRATIRVQSDQTSAERQALPMLADDFARHVVQQLVDGTW